MSTNCRINITPYKELQSGSESIFDHVQEGYTVPAKVITYLKSGNPGLMSPGIYPHPFHPDRKLMGPYKYTDGQFTWDRDTWMYVQKYNLVLPEEFINHVMSAEGTAFIEQQKGDSMRWKSVIKRWKESGKGVCFLPDNGGESDFENF